MKIKVGGKEIEVKDEAELQAVIDGLEGQMAAASKQAETLQGELAVATSDAAIDAKIAARDAAKAAADAKAAKVAALTAAGVVCDGQADAYIDGAYALLEKLPKGDGVSEFKGTETTDAEETTDAAPRPDPRAEMVARNRKRSQVQA